MQDVFIWTKTKFVPSLTCASVFTSFLYMQVLASLAKVIGACIVSGTCRPPYNDRVRKVLDKLIKTPSPSTTWCLCSQVTVNMFYYQRQQTEPVPLGYHNLEMTCRSLEPGEPYLLYVLSKRRPEQRLQVFAFQEYIPQYKGWVTSPRARRVHGAESATLDRFSLCIFFTLAKLGYY